MFSRAVYTQAVEGWIKTDGKTLLMSLAYFELSGSPLLRSTLSRQILVSSSHVTLHESWITDKIHPDLLAADCGKCANWCKIWNGGGFACYNPQNPGKKAFSSELLLFYVQNNSKRNSSLWCLWIRASNKDRGRHVAVSTVNTTQLSSIVLQWRQKNIKTLAHKTKAKKEFCLI